MDSLTSLGEYSIYYIQRLDIMTALRDDEVAHITGIDSRSDLLLHLQYTLRAQSTSRAEDLAAWFVSFVQTIARTDWGKLPCLSEKPHTHTEVLKRLLRIGAREYGGRESSGSQFFVAMLAWDAILTNLTILVPNNYPSHKQTLVTACGMRAPHAVHALPQLLPQLSANSEASVTLEGIKASMWDLLASGELEEFAVTIVEYGFGPSLTIPVILMWSLHFPECLNDFSTPIILQRYNISLCRRGVATTPMSIGTLPGPPLSLSTSHFEAQGNSPRVQRDPVAAGSSARDIALSYLHGRETDPVKISERTTFFYSRMEPNDNEPRAPLEHGSNISSVQGEERGSLGVFLAPLSRPMESYLLSAQHVFSGPIGSAVQTFSHLDTLRRLAQIARCKNMPTAEQEAKFAFTLRLPYRNVATLTKSLFGVDAKGWRKDWALCRISDGYAGVNGRFTMDQERNLRMALKLDDKCVFRDGLGVAKAIEGSKVFKVGATTGITGGVVNKTNVCVYSRDTAEAEIDIQNPAPSDTLTMILPLPGVNIPFCAGGDSGAGVFACNKGRFSWVGLLVAMAPVEMVDGVLTKNIGLMVPQDVILSQIEKETGTKWGLYRGRRKWPGPLWPSGYLGFILCLILVLLIC